MREKLQALSSEELNTMAGEILRSLAAAEKKSAGAEQTENEWLLRRGTAETENALPVSHTPAGYGGTAAETKSPEAERFGGFSAAPGAESIGIREAYTRSVRLPDAEAISEMFRRDSRRYDSGFEKY